MSFQQCNHPVGFRRVSPETVYPISPVTVVGAFVPLHFNMSFDGRVRIFGEAGFPVGKVEALVSTLPVMLFPPGTAFAGVLPFGPFG